MKTSQIGSEGGGVFQNARGFGRDRVREEREIDNERGDEDGVWGRGTWTWTCATCLTVFLP
jgi:hypothetical protein